MDAALRAVCRAWVLARPVLPPKKETPGVSALQMSLRLIDCARAMLSWSCETRGGGNARALGVVGGVSRLWGSPRSLLQAFGRPAAACTLHLHEPTGDLRSVTRFGAGTCSEELVGLIKRPKPRNCRALLQALNQRSAYLFVYISSCLAKSRSFNQRLPHAAHNRYPQRSQPVWIIGSYDVTRRQHGIVRSNVCGVFCCLLNGFHLFLAACVIEGTDDDWLAEKDIPC